jgi:hypothetical protein
VKILAGQLSINPYLKSFDELQRTKKRMQNYLDINSHLLSDEEEASIEQLIIFVGQALSLIPQEFRKTKHQYSQKD